MGKINAPINQASKSERIQIAFSCGFGVFLFILDTILIKM
jgi:hypothetical protein